MRKRMFLTLMSLLLMLSTQLIKSSLCSAQCPDSIDPSFKTFVPIGGTHTINITAPSGCSWTATSNDGWITINSGNSGTGNGTVEYLVADNSGCECDGHVQRTGTITIGDMTFTVFQGSELDVGYISGRVHDAVNSAGLNGATINIFSKDRLTTSITDGGYFIQITETDETFNPPYTINVTRTGYLDKEISGVVVEFLELTSLDIPMSPCTSDISTTSKSFISDAGSGSVDVTAPSGCSWAATSNDSWITITSDSSVTGNGTLNYSVSKNTDISLRTGTMTIAGKTFTVTQEGTCSYSISPASQSLSSSDDTGSVSVSAPDGCSWTALSNDTDWITITSGNSGSGNGTVNYSVLPNTSASSRTGTMTIAGKTFTVTQEGTCSYSISPASQSLSSDGGSGSVDVTATSGCSWTASSNTSWITITSGISGSGNGTVNYSVLPNTSASSRTGTMTIAGKTFTAGQAGVGAIPAPDVKANGSDIPIILETSNPLLVSISLAAGGSLGIDGDWWAAAYTPFGWYHYDVGSDSWLPGLIVTYQGSLINLTPPFTVLSMTGLPVGIYTFYFGVDMVMNGTLDIGAGLLFFDSVEVSIIP